jgi:dTDP-glucose pyrophosphorylase
MIRGGADKICFVISAGKSDIVAYFGSNYGDAFITYVVQPRACGLCDAIFRASPLIGPDESVMVGLHDTVWFPEDALMELPEGELSFLLFPVNDPQHFDAVVMNDGGEVVEIQVKRRDASSRWIWGAFKMSGRILQQLRELWLLRDCVDEYLGSLINAYLAGGGCARAFRAGSSYVDVGTLHGYRSAIGLLADAQNSGEVRSSRSVPGRASATVLPDVHHFSRDP